MRSVKVDDIGKRLMKNGFLSEIELVLEHSISTEFLVFLM